jgi:hypothetical protein
MRYDYSQTTPLYTEPGVASLVPSPPEPPSPRYSYQAATAIMKLSNNDRMLIYIIIGILVLILVLMILKHNSGGYMSRGGCRLAM